MSATIKSTIFSDQLKSEIKVYGWQFLNKILSFERMSKTMSTTVFVLFKFFCNFELKIVKVEEREEKRWASASAIKHFTVVIVAV